VNSTTNQTICSNQLPFSWNGKSYTSAGTYKDTLTSAAGCDSIAILIFSVNPFVKSTTNQTICSNQLPFSWNGKSYTSAGTYKDTLTSAAGCDSIAILILSVNPFVKSTTNQKICSNQLPFSWNGNNYTAAGTYNDTLISAAGCDSVAILVLTVNPFLKSTTNQTICFNQLPYSWNGHNYTSAGTYNDTLTGIAGCDSIATLNLIILPSPKLIITNPAAVCSSTTVDITAPAITAGSSTGLTYTYWKDAANKIPLENPAKVATSGIYYIHAVALNKCLFARTVPVVVIITKSIIPVRYPTVITEEKVPLRLEARTIDNSSSYQWDPTEGLNFSSGKTPVFNYNKETEYTISILSESGCLTVDTLLVRIATHAKPRSDIYVPKAWSPNDDGHNDKLFPLTVNIRQIIYFRIFNRWGQLVFETNKIGHGWNGIFKGNPQVSDVYTWTLEAFGDDDKHYRFNGSSLLLR
jgi:gliding motility-associated-like protein